MTRQWKVLFIVFLLLKCTRFYYPIECSSLNQESQDREHHRMQIQYERAVTSSPFITRNLQQLRTSNRKTNELITTTTCSNIRSNTDYNSRIDFTYLYLLEFNITATSTTPTYLTYDDANNMVLPVLINTIELAIAKSVATTLVQCTTTNDDQDQYPLYAVEVFSTTKLSKHIIIPTSTGNTSDTNHFNASWSTNSCPLHTSSTIDTSYQCITVRGMTSILFNEEEQRQDEIKDDTTSGNFNNTNIASFQMDWVDDVDTLIAVTIQDSNYLNQLVLLLDAATVSNTTVQITQTKYVQSLGTNIFPLPSTLSDSNPSDQNNIGKTVSVRIVVVITAVLSFTFTVMLLSLIFLYCRCFLSKRQNSQIYNKSKNQKHSSPRIRLRRHDQYTFEPFEEDDYESSSNNPNMIAPQGWIVATSGSPQNVMTTNTAASSTYSKPNEEFEQQLSPVTRMVTTTYSDITSDSESIMSSLHLDRIDEVDEEMGDLSYEQYHHNSDDDDEKLNNNNGIEVRLRSQSNIDSNEAELSNQLPDSNADFIFLQNFATDWDGDAAWIEEENFINENQNNTFTDLSVEVSIDNVLMYTSDDSVKNTSIDNPFPVNTISDKSFTFSSDDQSDRESDDGCFDNTHANRNLNRKHSDRKNEHFYDSEDFQSIEISVTWLDEQLNVRDDEKENNFVFYADEGNVPVPTVSIDSATKESSSYDRTKSSSTEHLSYRNTETTDESLTILLPLSLTGTVSTQPISDITNSKKFMLQDSTESTTNTKDEYSYTSSGAYRSVLDRQSNSNETSAIIVDSTSTAGGSTSNDSVETVHSNKDAMLTRWANDVLLKLMSDSPKMLQCDQAKNIDSWQTNDTESQS